MGHPRNVLPERHGPTEDEFHALLIAGLSRVAAAIGKPTLAKRMGRTIRQFGNIMAGSIPEAPAIFDTLLIDQTALDELLRSYGFCLAPLQSDGANDLLTAAGVIGAMGELVKARADGVRDHNETLGIAALLRPHLPAMMAIVGEADNLRKARQ